MFSIKNKDNAKRQQRDLYHIQNMGHMPQHSMTTDDANIQRNFKAISFCNHDYRVSRDASVGSDAQIYEDAKIGTDASAETNTKKYVAT